MRVFISHSAADKHFVNRLRDALNQREIRTWADEDIRPGASWTTAIKRAIEEADVIVPVISAESEKSHSVSSEISLALAERLSGGHKLIIPVLADRKAEGPFFLKDFQWVDLSTDDRFERNLDRLVTAIRAQEEDVPFPALLADRRERLQAEQAVLQADMKTLEQRSVQRTRFVIFGLTIAAFVSILAVLTVWLIEGGNKREWIPIVTAAFSFIIGVITALASSRLLRRAERDEPKPRSRTTTER